MVFSGYSDFLHQWNWPSQNNWNIVQSGVKDHNHNPLPYKIQIISLFLKTEKQIDFLFREKYHLGPPFFTHTFLKTVSVSEIFTGTRDIHILC